MISLIKNIISIIENLLFIPRKSEGFIENFSFEKNNLPRSKDNIFDNIFPQLLYKDENVKSLIWEIKYHRNKKAIEMGANIIFEAIKEDILEKELFSKDKYTIVNIPITKNKLKEKGFCHTELLCIEIENLAKKDLFLNSKINYNPNILQKIKETKPQSHTKSKEERFHNLSNCFNVKTKTDNYIILIDDVVTTSATIKEAVKTLNC